MSWLSRLRTLLSAQAPCRRGSRARREGGLDVVWVQVGGELDIATTLQLNQTLDASQTRPLVLDLRSSRSPAAALGRAAAGGLR